ncbi:MAG: hypothetical protein FWE06_03625 [Oscillospiraceae bacterium]|nr:hypothetical protein [Oscillospiraceae bacterium]
MNDNVKDLLEKVKEKGTAAAEIAGKTASSAGKKAGEIWSITRLRMQVYDLNTELSNLYRQMGEIVYTAHIDVEADTSDIEGLLEQAEQKINAINLRREKIEVLKLKGKDDKDDDE